MTEFDISEWMKDPQFKAEYKRLEARNELALRLTSWMRRIPVLGYYTFSFWYLLLSEGVHDTLKPRWGGVTFAFLNDGMGATVWHTWRSMTDPQGEFSGIYVKGAPESLKQAQEWDEMWNKQHACPHGGVFRGETCPECGKKVS